MSLRPVAAILLAGCCRCNAGMQDEIVIERRRHRPGGNGQVRRSRRRFQCLYQWRMDQGHAHSRRQVELWRLAPCWPTRRGSACWRSFRNRPTQGRGQRRIRGRSAISTRAFMDEAAIESKGIAPLKPQLDTIAAIADRHALARVLGGQLRADVDAVERHQLRDREPFRSLGDAGPDGPVAQLPLPAAGRSRNAGSRLLSLRDSAHGRVAASSTRRISRRCSSWRASTTLPPVPHACSRSRRRWREAHATRVESEDVHTAVSWKRDELTAKAPGLDWPALLDAAGLKDAPASIVWHPKAIPGLSALAASEPLDAWKDWLAFHAIERAGQLPSEGIRRRALQLLRQGAQRHSGVASALAAGNGLHQRGAGRGGRQAVRGALFPGRHQGEGPGHGRRSGAGVRQKDRRAHLDVARDQGQGETEAGHAEGRRRLSRPVAGLLGPRDRQRRRARQRAARRAVRVPPAARQTPPAGRPRRVVDDPADRERGQSAAAERAELSGRDPAAALLRSAMPTRRTTTAPWERSSATRSATASTTRAASSMPKAGWPTGGRRTTSTTSRPPAKRSPRSSTLTNRSPIWR